MHGFACFACLCLDVAGDGAVVLEASLAGEGDEFGGGVEGGDADLGVGWWWGGDGGGVEGGGFGGGHDGQCSMFVLPFSVGSNLCSWSLRVLVVCACRGHFARQREIEDGSLKLHDVIFPLSSFNPPQHVKAKMRPLLDKDATLIGGTTLRLFKGERLLQPVESDRNVYITQMRGKLLPAPPANKCRMRRAWLELSLSTPFTTHHGVWMVQQLEERPDEAT